jgi:hypothetical protein
MGFGGIIAASILLIIGIIIVASPTVLLPFIPIFCALVTATPGVTIPISVSLIGSMIVMIGVCTAEAMESSNLHKQKIDFKPHDEIIEKKSIEQAKVALCKIAENLDIRNKNQPNYESLTDKLIHLGATEITTTEKTTTEKKSLIERLKTKVTAQGI